MRFAGVGQAFFQSDRQQLLLLLHQQKKEKPGIKENLYKVYANPRKHRKIHKKPETKNTISIMNGIRLWHTIMEMIMVIHM